MRKYSQNTYLGKRRREYRHMSMAFFLVSFHPLTISLLMKYSLTQDNARSGRMFSPRGISPWKKNACIVGLGNLGHAIAERLSAIGMMIKGGQSQPGECGYARVNGRERVFPDEQTVRRGLWMSFCDSRARPQRRDIRHLWRVVLQGDGH